MIEAVNSGSPHYQRVISQTEIFHEPIPIDRARELCPAMNTDGYFITTRQIDEASVQAFYEEGLR